MTPCLHLALLSLVIGGAVSWCPPLFSVPSVPSSTISRPRALNELCCQTGGSCRCGTGLQCCTNMNFRFLCVVDPCDPNPCGNGVCATNSDGSRRCFCSIGTVQNRQGLCIEDPCLRNPCGRGGRCFLSASGSGNPYECRCSGDQTFDGKTCVAGTCGRLRCGSGRCRLNSRNRAFCDCEQGFRFDGQTCIRDNACRNQNCGAGGRCREVNGRAVCSCDNGFRLDRFTRVCVSDDPCSSVNCGRGSCTRSGVNRAVCNCDNGFSFDSRRVTCIQNANSPPPPAPPVPVSQTSTVTDPINTRHGGTCTGLSCTCDAGFVQQRNTNTCQVQSPCQAASSQDTSITRFGNGVNSGCLMSRNFPQPYPDNLFDEVVISTTGFRLLTVVIQDMEIQISGSNMEGFVQNDCFNDYLFVSGQLFCGSLTRPGAHRVFTVNVQGRSEVIVGMVSDSNTSFKGFLLKWQLS
ncbi:delta-like protein B [Watersipora subatra]|uniref:delta-like protein B n=1 Tax=Watersipora subatra TaxID=2589382 RepID=UPI00355B1A68